MGANKLMNYFEETLDGFVSLHILHGVAIVSCLSASVSVSNGRRRREYRQKDSDKYKWDPNKISHYFFSLTQVKGKYGPPNKIKSQTALSHKIYFSWLPHVTPFFLIWKEREFKCVLGNHLLYLTLAFQNDNPSQIHPSIKFADHLYKNIYPTCLACRNMNTISGVADN